jgi:DNA topoisomerase-1
MQEFWQGFYSQIEGKQEVERPGTEVLDESCPKCGKPLSKRLGKRGSFIGCTGYPECDYTRNLDGEVTANNEPVNLGLDPASGKEILLLNGPYGPYLQLGQTGEDPKKKPKRVSIPKEIPLANVNHEIALKLIALPREVGLHPDTGKKITAGIGRFGPYLNHNGTFKSIPKSDSLFDIDLARAVELLAQAKTKAAALKELGVHPEDGAAIAIYSGRYGPYVQHGKVNATLPKEMEIDSLTLEQALTLLAAKAAKGTNVKKKTAAKKTPSKTNSRKKAV